MELRGEGLLPINMAMEPGVGMISPTVSDTITLILDVTCYDFIFLNHVFNQSYTMVHNIFPISSLAMIQVRDNRRVQLEEELLC